MKKLMNTIAVITGIGFIACLISYSTFLHSGLLLTFTISFGVTFYHFAMRLIVGGIVNYIKSCNPGNFWFREKHFEKKLCRVLNVHKLKKYFPTYDPKQFDVSNGMEFVINSSCIAELCHEIIVVMSFLPLLMNIAYPSVAYIITSVIAALVDSCFVVIQRYNRPRLIKAKSVLAKRDSHK